jgi:hypothetical protein
VKRTAVVLLAVGTLAAAPASMAPAHAADFGGFTTHATASALKVEVFEPAIPIPAEPQMEFNLSYTRVDGASGPIGTARASAMWPGDSVGEGFKTIGEQLGLPDALTKDGYPEQVNAQSPGDVTQAVQEPLPGMTTRVSASDQKATAKVGYGTSGDVAEGQLDGDPAPTDPLAALTSGDLTALGSILTGTATGTADDPPSTNPLGALGILINATGMNSVSSTNYGGDTVVATATSRLGELDLLAGLVQLKGIEVVARTTSNLSGAKTTYKVRFGGMTIAGTPFEMTSDGFVAAGSTTAIPSLPDDSTAALKALGISFDLPKPRMTNEGASGSIALEGLRITLDTGPLRAMLPALPLGDLINQLPEQAGQLKSLLLAATEAHPKFVVSVGAVAAEATTVPPISAGSETSPPSGSSGTAGTAGTSGTAGTAPLSTAPVDAGPATAPVTTTPVNTAASIPGLPPLGSIPMMLILAGLLLATGAGWYLRRAGGLLFGTGALCTHGLKAGVPDLRKA